MSEFIIKIDTRKWDDGGLNVRTSFAQCVASVTFNGNVATIIEEANTGQEGGEREWTHDVKELVERRALNRVGLLLGIKETR